MPDFYPKPITEKFYARHDNFESALFLNKYKEKIAAYAEEIEKRQKFDRREHQSAPSTTNQSYGWLEFRAELDKTASNKDLFYFPIKVDPFMKLLGEIKRNHYHLKGLMRMKL